jgi:hypothetical protein
LDFGCLRGTPGDLHTFDITDDKHKWTMDTTLAIISLELLKAIEVNVLVDFDGDV